jgi:hypothetical protein
MRELRSYPGTGDFCEACGARLPVAEPTPAAAPGAVPPPPPPQAPPTYGAQAPYAYTPGQYADITQKGFWSRFFDFSFKSFVTPSLIKVLFIVFMVVIGLSVLGMIVGGFMASAATGVLFLIGGLIYGFLALLWARVILEIVIIFFRIHENTDEIKKDVKKA